jgi:amino acid permease
LYLGLGLILFGGFLNYSTFMILNRSVEFSGKKSYPNVCSYFFGKNWARAFTFILLLSNFMACVVYPTVVWSFIEAIFYKQLKLPIDNPALLTFKEYDPVTYKWRALIMGGMSFAMLTINLCKEFAALRYLSVFILVTIISTIGVSLG